ncbi:MAG TPA: type 2 lanthipeptide synthetase LanM family protein, partial [Vicinamibacterales bacterium]|nr:type 2 lanthipeptide synthetase LanM family protein [Vicinamibacterales bacterium]
MSERLIERGVIAARARTIYERTDALRRQSIVRASRVEGAALAALASWARAYAPGNPEALTPRLAWDDLTPELVAAALDAPPDEMLPAWTEWIDRIEDAARTLAAELRASRRSTQNAPNPQSLSSLQEGNSGSARSALDVVDVVPYAEIWTAVVRAARGRLDRRIEALERQLARELSALGELAIDEAFSQYVAARGIDRRSLNAASSDWYRAFVLSVLDEGLMPLWTAYPVLARQTAIVADGWVASTIELVERFDADRARIAATLNAGADPGVIVDIEPGLSDAHDGRRRVSVLHFAHGLRVVYKPRDVEIERAFGALAAWLAARGFDPPVRVSRVVAGDGYGWVEFAAHDSFETGDEVRGYFRQAGALLFLTHLLGSKDLHMENLVATRDGPVVIDLELLLQPELKPAAQSDADRSCLRTGLLSLVELGPGDDAFDVGGLRGTGRMPLAAARRLWRNLGTDAISSVEETIAHADVKNTVVLNGRPQSPDAYRAEILDGFTRAYAFALAHRNEWLAADGPLAAFRSAAVRVIARPTNQYALLTTVHSAPRYQRDGAVRSMLVDVLIRPLAAANDRPREWPLIVEERRAIDAIDVPRFVVPADRRTIFSAGRAILPDYFARSPLDAVRERLAGLSGDDCESQLRTLQRALADSIDSRFAVPFESGDEDFAAAAEWIGREMLARASERVGALLWSPDDAARAASHHLYGGSIGPAVFLSALSATTGSPVWHRAARGALTPALAWSESAPSDRDLPIGGCSGLGSIVYGLTTAAALIGDERAIAAARRVAAMIDRDRVARDRSFDIVDGAAGALLSVLALHAITGDAALLATAKACGDRLLAAHGEHPAGWTGPAAAPGDARRLVGFAHGAAGIATALARLADATGHDSYRAGASHAFAFVTRNFSQADATWPVAEADATDISTTIIRMSAWCHGAPGISIAAASANRAGGTIA